MTGEAEYASQYGVDVASRRRPGAYRLMPIPDSKARRRERFAAFSAAGLILVLLAGLLFLLVVGLVVSNWAPLRSFDTAVVDTFNAALQGRPLVVDALRVLTYLGGSEAAWLLFPVAVVWLLVRRLPDLALYVAVTGSGSGILSTGTKELVERVRPVVEIPVASAPGHSFPSGHAMGATTLYGVLVLTFLPVVPDRWRRPLIGAAVLVVLLVGLTRVALGVHYPSDVFGGWLMGLLWLFVTASAFRRFEQRDEERHRPLSMGLAPEERASLEPAPVHDSPLPRGWHSVSELLVVAVILWGAMVGLGLVVTNLVVVGEIDLAVSEWFAAHRSETISDVAILLGRLGGTAVIVAVLVACVLLAAALTRRWAPALFLLLATTGESALFLAISEVVGRSRPSVEKITDVVPPTTSFPSGHVAATLVTYGSIALLVLVWSRSRLRYAAPAFAVCATIVVALSRIYRGVHYPTDTLASVLYGSCWMMACWLILRPWRGAHAGQRSHESDTPVAANRAEPINL